MKVRSEIIENPLANQILMITVMKKFKLSNPKLYNLKIIEIVKEDSPQMQNKYHSYSHLSAKGKIMMDLWLDKWEAEMKIKVW